MKPQRYERQTPYAFRNVPFTEDAEVVPGGWLLTAYSVAAFALAVLVLV